MMSPLQAAPTVEPRSPVSQNAASIQLHNVLLFFFFVVFRIDEVTVACNVYIGIHHVFFVVL